jgi:hypothetical protein
MDTIVDMIVVIVLFLQKKLAIEGRVCNGICVFVGFGFPCVEKVGGFSTATTSCGHCCTR